MIILKRKENKMYFRRLNNVIVDMRPEENTSKIGLAGDNRGIGVVEIVLILVVLVALVLIFKDKIIEIINKAFESITSGTDSL